MVLCMVKYTTNNTRSSNNSLFGSLKTGQWAFFGQITTDHAERRALKEILLTFFVSDIIRKSRKYYFEEPVYGICKNIAHSL